MERIGSQVANLERLVNDFRSFAKEPEPRLGVVDLRQIIEPVASDMREFIETSIHGYASVYADSHLLNRAFLNIWKNSMEAGASEINVTIEPANDKIKLVISDNGPGIPAERVGQVWIPYVTFKKGGTGLGLPVVKRIFESIGAETAMVTSTDDGDHGVTLIITFNNNLKAKKTSDLMEEDSERLIGS